MKTESGQMLRRFLDTNGDNKVDQWCYFKDGIEIYRDIDANFNNKADQYRWLGTAGTRWGLDDDENGRIDTWKIISAEEVTAEVVAALRDRDAARFQRLLLTADELKSLGLSEAQATELTDKDHRRHIGVRRRRQPPEARHGQVRMDSLRRQQAGHRSRRHERSEKDLIVYDNVTAVVETDGKHGQLVIGTLIKIGDTWRMFDLPKNLAGDQTAAAVGRLLLPGRDQRPARKSADPVPGSSVNPGDAEAGRTWRSSTSRSPRHQPPEQARLNAERADLLEKIIELADRPRTATCGFASMPRRSPPPSNRARFPTASSGCSRC